MSNRASTARNTNFQPLASVFVCTAIVCSPSEVPTTRWDPGMLLAMPCSPQSAVHRRLQFEHAQTVSGTGQPVAALGGDRGPHLMVLPGRQQTAGGEGAERLDHVSGRGDDVPG
jgi:hypothetical protein